MPASIGAKAAHLGGRVRACPSGDRGRGWNCRAHSYFTSRTPSPSAPFSTKRTSSTKPWLSQPPARASGAYPYT